MVVTLFSNEGSASLLERHASNAVEFTWVLMEAILEDEMPSNTAEMTTKGDLSCLERDLGQKI